MTDEARNTDGERAFTSRKIAEDFANDPGKAQKRYGDEPVRVRGTVQKIDNVISAVVVRLTGIGGTYDGTHLELKLRNRSDAEQLTSGDEAELCGRCDGLRTKTGPGGDELGLVMFTQADVVG